MILRFDEKTTSPRLSGGILAAAILLALPTSGEAQQLRQTLERVYRGAVSAMVSKNYDSWKLYTAKSRRVQTYNLVISQKQRWPEAMFDIPVAMPEIGTLGHLETFEKGDTATLIYYGKVDFGLVEEGKIPNNILVLKFIREEGKWKFDNTRFVNLAENPAIAHKAEINDHSFLSDERFQPSGEAPEVPKPIASPDYPGEIWIAAIGYEVKVKLGELHQATVRNDLTSDVVMGGLWKDGREISVEVTELELDDEQEAERRVEVAVYAFPNRQKGKRVWHWKPEPGKVPATYRSKVWANAVTMR